MTRISKAAPADAGWTIPRVLPPSSPKPGGVEHPHLPLPAFDYRDTIARHRLGLGDALPPLGTFVDEVVDDLDGWTESEKRFAFGDR